MAKKQVSITMELEGDAEVIQNLSSWALEYDVLKTYKVRENANTLTPVPAAKPPQERRRTRRMGHWVEVGMRVVTKWNSTHYGTKAGMAGEVVSYGSPNHGSGVLVRVNFDDPSVGIKDIPQSQLATEGKRKR